MTVLLVWFFGSIFVAMLGMGRKIGGFVAFIVSIVFSPVIGLIAVLLSKDKQTDQLEKAMLKEHHQKQNDMQSISSAEAAKQLEELNEVHRKKLISDSEFNEIRQRILNRIK